MLEVWLREVQENVNDNILTRVGVFKNNCPQTVRKVPVKQGLHYGDVPEQEHERYGKENARETIENGR